MAFVTVTAQTFADTFLKAGFTASVAQFGNEVVYSRRHTNPAYTVKVYTSISAGDSVARGVGADAIRACLVRESNGKTYGVGKTIRVNRTGTVEAVMERTLQRARDMWNLATKYSRPVNTHPVTVSRCRDCGQAGETTGHQTCQYPQDH